MSDVIPHQTREPEAIGPTGAGQVPGLVLDMARLGSPELGRDGLFKALRPLVTGYRRWLSAQASRAEPDSDIERLALAVTAARKVARRLARSIELLRTDEVAREAFRFANQAMARQRVHCDMARARMSSPSADAAGLLRRFDTPENRSWRPFQLAFLLLCLPGLTSPAHPDAARSGDAAEVLLLRVPDGGGKTEAYLGLAAYTFATRRLRGVAGPEGGVAVLHIRRRLTPQLVQRATALLCACEVLRRERLAAGDSRWGATPFRVGGAFQLPACPWCGSRLSPWRDPDAGQPRRRLLLYCSDPTGDCAFSPRNSPGAGLPVVTVDEEIKRLAPALVIATVDDLARLPWRAAAVTGPPDLIIGDELCPPPGPAGTGVRPLLVASATRSRASTPGLTVFPPPVPDTDHTYFSASVRPPGGPPAR